MSAASKNGTGTPRKQLSEQLDRLDGVIDALDEGLKGAVADAVRDVVGAAVQQAVETALVQVLTNPELQKLVRQAAATAEPPPHKDDKNDKEPPKPAGLLARSWGRVCSAARSCSSTAGTALAVARLAWQLSGSKTRTLVLATGAAAGAALWAARSRVAAAAASAFDLARGLLGRVAGPLCRPAAAFVS